MANIFNVDRINNVIVMGTTGTTTRFPFLTASRITYLNGECDITSISDLTAWVGGTANQITATDDGDGTLTLSIPNPLAIPGKLTAGSFASPLDVTNTRKYGFEIHYSGNDYDVTGLRSRAQLVTTDTTATAQGALIQATNNDNVDAGCLNGCLIEAIGKADTNATTITMMRGCLVNTEWSAKDTVTDLRVLHVRTHTRDAATEGYVSGTGYGIYIENEAVGGNGQALDAGIYFKGTNLSAGNNAFTHGIDFSGGTYTTAEIKLSNGETIGNLTDGQVAVSGNITLLDDGWIGRSATHCMVFDDTLTEVRFQSQLVSAYFDGEWNVFELQNFYTGIGNGGSYNLYRARGTQASPSAVLDNDVLGRIEVRGYDGDTWEDAAAIKFFVNDTVSDGVVPGKIAFFTTDSGGSWGQRLSIINNGKVGVGVDAKTLLTVEGTITLKEQAAADGDTAAYGQLWVKSDAPNILMFTDDAGTDFTVDVTAV